MKEYILASLIIFVIYSLIGVLTDLFFARNKFIRRTAVILYYGSILNFAFSLILGIYKLIT